MERENVSLRGHLNDFTLAYHQSSSNESKLSSSLILEKQRAATELRNNEYAFEQRLNIVKERVQTAENVIRDVTVESWNNEQRWSRAASEAATQCHNTSSAVLETIKKDYSKELSKQLDLHRQQMLQVQDELVREKNKTGSAAQQISRIHKYYDGLLKEQAALTEGELKDLKDNNHVIVIQNEKLKEELLFTKDRLNAALEEKGHQALRYSDFLGHGRMKKHGAAFFPFPFDITNPNMDCVELFLEIINVKNKDDDYDLGVCSRLRRYSHVQALKRAGVVVTGDLPSPAIRGLASTPGSKGRPRKLLWKDEFLIYCCFHHAGMTNRQIQALMDVSSGVISNAIRSYADYLDIFFGLAFPNPTRDELRRNYPSSFIETFGHAMIAMILDCTDQGMQDPRSKLSHSLFWSQYHKTTGAKFVIGCTPIGMVPHSWCPNGYPSSISDPNVVIASKIIETNLQRGDIVEVDKGFLIENICSLWGIRVMRPTTSRNNQRQASAGDTEKTKSIGNTRIIIEQVNRQGKSEFRLWNCKFYLQMKDCMSQLMRNGFMFANFKPAFVIGRDKV